MSFSVVFQWAPLISLIYISLSITPNGIQSESRWGRRGGNTEGGGAAAAHATYRIPAAAGRKLSMLSSDAGDRQAPGAFGSEKWHQHILRCSKDFHTHSYHCHLMVLLFDFPGVFQENGQRRYGGPPPGWDGPAPERGSEIFVGKLPRDLFEDELVPLCEKVRERAFPPRSFLHSVVPIFLNVPLPISSLVRSTKWGWWWTLTGTTEVTPSSHSTPNWRLERPWSSSTTMRSGQGALLFFIFHCTNV